MLQVGNCVATAPLLWWWFAKCEKGLTEKWVKPSQIIELEELASKENAYLIKTKKISV
jgi:hypothetical protein